MDGRARDHVLPPVALGAARRTIVENFEVELIFVVVV